MKKFCIYQRELAADVINFEKKKTKMQRNITSVEKIFKCAARSICSLRFNVLKEIPIVFHNGSNFILFYHERISK